MISVSHEDDLWKLFSDAPDKPGNSIVAYNDHLRKYLDLKIDGKKIELSDTEKKYQLFAGSFSNWRPEGARTQVIVTQANLRRVGSAMQRKCGWVYVQYLGNDTIHD